MHPQNRIPPAPVGAAHLWGTTLSIRSPDELIALIPHLLGFKPEESLVFLPMGSELPAARVDLPTTLHDREVVWNSLRDAYGRHAQPSSSLAIVCLTADREMATDVGHEFAARFDTIGIDTRIMLWADETRWADLQTGDMGLRTDAARERIAAATALSGRAQPAADRSSLAESLVGDRTPVADLLPEIRDAARENTAHGWRALADQTGALREELTDVREEGPAGEGSLLPESTERYLEAAATTIEDLGNLAPVVPQQVRHAVEEADTTLDHDVADWFDPDVERPRLVLLGPVDAEAFGEVKPVILKRRPYFVEILAYLALHPKGATASEPDDEQTAAGDAGEDPE